MSKIPEINNNNQDNFFYKLNEGDVFKYSPSYYLFEDINNIAIAGGKKVQQIDCNSALFELIGSNCCIVVRDIKKSALNIRNEEILRLQSELSKCYQRFDNLETELGIRGAERLERCEICKKHILPYQNWINTDTLGKAHIECDLNKTIEELQKSNRKKDETIIRWSKDAQRFGHENQSLRIEREELKNTANELRSENNLLIETTENIKKDIKDLEIESVKLESVVSKNNININEFNNINKTYEELLRNSLSLIIRTIRLLGEKINGEFNPIPVIHLSGEQRMELKGWCESLYNELYECMIQIKEVL
jgi:hypothetical protein